MDYVQLGRRIQMARTTRQLSQKELAKQLTCSIKHLGNIERGTSHPSLECLIDIASTLNLSIDYLLSGNISFSASSTQFSLFPALDQLFTEHQHSMEQLHHQLWQIYDNPAANSLPVEFCSNEKRITDHLELYSDEELIIELINRGYTIKK